MTKLILVVLLAVIAAGGGVIGGAVMKPAKPAPETAPDMQGDEPAPADETVSAAGGKPQVGPWAKVAEPDRLRDPESGTMDYVKLNKQFIVPVVDEERVTALMVVSLAVEVDEGASTAVFTYEPKLRDEFLKVLFLHAQSGGFSGAFTDASAMGDLRGSLAVAAREVLGARVRAVLLTNVVRQDL